VAKSKKITTEDTGHNVNGSRCGILYDVTPTLARALGVKHLQCSGCMEKFALRIGKE
jgi:hypothetical protein